MPRTPQGTMSLLPREMPWMNHCMVKAIEERNSCIIRTRFLSIRRHSSIRKRHYERGIMANSSVEWINQENGESRIKLVVILAKTQNSICFHFSSVGNRKGRGVLKLILNQLGHWPSRSISWVNNSQRSSRLSWIISFSTSPLSSVNYLPVLHFSRKFSYCYLETSYFGYIKISF
jgi:hypothetical protein